MMTPHIRLISATAISIEPVQQAFQALWPEARLSNLLDDSLLDDLRTAGHLTPAITRRIDQLATLSAEAGASGILFTCSAFGPAIEAARDKLNIPVYKPYEAMVSHAVARGERLGLIATYTNTIEEMRKVIQTQSTVTTKPVHLETRLAKGAIDALESGDRKTHDALIVECARELHDCDILLLAQFSMAPAATIIEPQAGQTVLTSTACAVELFKQQLGSSFR